MALLIRYCEDILPLPPFEVWANDRSAHPAAHLDEAEPDRVPMGAGPPVTVAIRRLEGLGRQWTAELAVRPEGDVWRGHITFRAPEGSHGHSTGEVFREGAAEAVRARFLEFDDHTLRAFLRSALP